MTFIFERMTREELSNVYSKEHGLLCNRFWFSGDIGRWQQDWITDRERGIYVLALNTGEVTEEFTYLALFWHEDCVVVEILKSFVLDNEFVAKIQYISTSIKDKIEQIQMFFNEAINVGEGLYIAYREPIHPLKLTLSLSKGAK